MRTASMVLGIVGGCVALVLAILSVLGGLMLTSILPDMFETELFDELGVYEQVEDVIEADLAEESILLVTNIGGSFLWIYAALLFICAAAGIAGGIIVKKQNIAAGVLMLVGGVLAIVTVWGILAGALTAAGGILALVKEKTDDEPAVSEQA